MSVTAMKTLLIFILVFAALGCDAQTIYRNQLTTNVQTNLVIQTQSDGVHIFTGGLKSLWIDSISPEDSLGILDLSTINVTNVNILGSLTASNITSSGSLTASNITSSGSLTASNITSSGSVTASNITSSGTFTGNGFGLTNMILTWSSGAVSTPDFGAQANFAGITGGVTSGLALKASAPLPPGLLTNLLLQAYGISAGTNMGGLIFTNGVYTGINVLLVGTVANASTATHGSDTVHIAYLPTNGISVSIEITNNLGAGSNIPSASWNLGLLQR